MDEGMLSGRPAAEDRAKRPLIYDSGNSSGMPAVTSHHKL